MPSQTNAASIGKAYMAHVLTDPGRGLPPAAAHSARIAAWKGQAEDATMRQDRQDTWYAQNEA